METVEEFIKRANLNNLREFLIYGVSNTDKNSICGNTDAKTYDERIINDSSEILELLEKLCPDENNLEKAVTALDKALRAYQEVYAEAGLKAGANLIIQLLTK